MNNLYYLTIVDWSGDGHSLKDKMLISVNRTIQEIRLSYLEAVKLTGVSLHRGLCVEDVKDVKWFVCTEYEEMEMQKAAYEALCERGLNLGIGFQIWDDYLDMSSDEGTLGKDIGNDIRNGKKTLIAVHALNTAAGEDKKILEKIFGNRKATEEEVKQVFNLFKKLGSIDYAKKTSISYCDTAKNSLNVLKDTGAKQILLKLAEYSISREN